MDKPILTIQYPEGLFTRLRLDLMMIRFELADAERGADGLVPQDMARIFSDLCALDNQVIEAQKARGFSDAETLRELKSAAAERKSTSNVADRSRPTEI